MYNTINLFYESVNLSECQKSYSKTYHNYNTTQSTETNRRLNEVASKIPSGLINCASKGRREKISPPFIRIASRRGIDRQSAIALLDRARGEVK